ncbi:MAG: hypothetical protein MR536_05735 [Prevotella sp.]|nr:hypothetical protein [Prevotella sp.]
MRKEPFFIFYDALRAEIREGGNRARVSFIHSRPIVSLQSFFHLLCIVSRAILLTKLEILAFDLYFSEIALKAIYIVCDITNFTLPLHRQSEMTDVERR